MRPDRLELRGAGLGVAGEFVKVVNIDQNTQLLAQTDLNELINTREDLGTDSKIGCRPRVMMPADRNAHVVKTFVLDQAKVRRAIMPAPVLAGWSFEAVGEVGPAEEAFGHLVCLGSSPRDRPHVAKARGPDSAAEQADRHGAPACDIEPGEERLVVPGSRIAGPGDGGSITRLWNDRSAAALPGGGRATSGRLEPAAGEARAFRLDFVPEHLLAVHGTLRDFFPRTHQRQRDGARARGRELDRQRSPANVRHGKADGKASRLIGRRDPVHPGDRAVSRDHAAVFERAGTGISGQVESRGRRQLDRFAFRTRGNRNHGADQGEADLQCRGSSMHDRPTLRRGKKARRPGRMTSVSQHAARDARDQADPMMDRSPAAIIKVAAIMIRPGKGRGLAQRA